MIDQQKIYEFALEWIGILENPDTREGDIDVRPGEECADLKFVMDCGKSFEERYSFEAFTDPTAFSEIAESIDDAAFLGSAIYSKWRGIAYWWSQNLLEPRNRVWFKFALMRLAELTEPEDKEETYECFRGAAERIYDSLRFMFADKSDDEQTIYENLASLGQDFEKAYRRILLSDALFTNTDRHMRNFGVIRSALTGDILRMAPNFDNKQAYRANPGGRFTDGMLRVFKASFGLTQNDVNDLNTLIEACKKNKYLAAAAEIGERFLNN